MNHGTFPVTREDIGWGSSATAARATRWYHHLASGRDNAYKGLIIHGATAPLRMPPQKNGLRHAILGRKDTAELHGH